MRIAVLGGGFTGMTAAYYLAKKGHEVSLYEKEKVLGGLAVGFRQPNWDWYLERAYHHLLDSEDDILNFARDLGFKDIFFKETQTSSLYEIDRNAILGNGATTESDTGQVGMIKQILNQVQDDKTMKNIYRIFPLDSPQDLLNFPLLSLPEKIRAGIVLAFLKFSPFLNIYEKQTAADFLRKTQGEHVWEVLWQQLFRKKFGKYAEKILATFIWARVTKRAKKLGYIKGGFQTFINHVKNELDQLRVKVLTDYEVKTIEKRNEEFFVIRHPEFISGSDSKKQMLNQVQRDKIVKKKFDVIISTLPTVIMSKITQNIFPSLYLQKFSNLKYLHAVVMILETKEKILDKTYWLNVCTPKVPIMIVAQHTNFVDKKNYGGNHIAYVGWYIERKDPLIKMSAKEVLNYYLPHLHRVSSFKFHVSRFYKFVGPFAQPIFDREFIKNKPAFKTPVKNFYIANLDMTYPYDRGTNYAVKLGREVSNLIK